MSSPDGSATGSVDSKRRETEQGLTSLSKHGGDDQSTAARLIQRNYRGYRTRRQLKGLGLDAETRWTDVGVLHERF